MRFVIAIVAFVLSAILIGTGIAQHTIFAPPRALSSTVHVPGKTHYVVVTSSAMNAYEGNQKLSVSGYGDSKSLMVAYGRTADVMAWIGNDKYARVDYSKGSSTLTASVESPHNEIYDSYYPQGANISANPAGSDLWLGEFNGSAARDVDLSIPAGMSVIISGNGKEVAPSSLTVSWPIDHDMFVPNFLLATGAILLLIGLLLYLWGVYRHRSPGGPRRRSGKKMPRLPKSPVYKPVGAPKKIASGTRLFVPIVCSVALVGIFGSSAAYADSSTTSTATPTATGSATMPPAVTVAQLKAIVKRISAVAAQADASGNATLAQTRFSGPALQLRTADYAIRAKASTQATPLTIPAGPIELALPQATNSWPRTVVAVVSSPAGSDGKPQAPIGLALEQENPRANYLVNYAVALQPDAKVPNLAAATVGTSVVPPDSKLLAIQPNKLGSAYGDVLLNGTSSTWISKFDLSSDKLVPQVGTAYKQKVLAELQANSGNKTSLSWTSQQGAGPIISMATNDSGAIVWVNPEEVQLQKVVQAGAEIVNGPSVAALTGLSNSTTGIQSTFGYQLVFYVPPAGSTQKIQLLGFSQGLIAASQIN